VDIGNSLRETILAITANARKTRKGFFSDKKRHGDYQACFGNAFLKTDVGFCPINVRPMPFTSSRALKQSPQYGSVHEHR